MAIMAVVATIDATGDDRCRCAIVYGVGLQNQRLSFHSFNSGCTVGYCGIPPDPNACESDRRRYVNNKSLNTFCCNDYCRVNGASDPNCVSCCSCCCGRSGTCYTGSNDNCTRSTSATTVSTTPTTQRKLSN